MTRNRRFFAMCATSAFVACSFPVFSQASTLQKASTTASAEPQVPANLFLPPNPPAPSAAMARRAGLPYLMSERSTNYYHASASQGKNIQLVAKRLNGLVVKPGETFSYNHHLGPYTAANGYGWGRAFSADRIIPSMGGGVCQGASTLYSALLRTNLTIVERHQHELTVPYLPAGEDATVSESAHLDFRFRNSSSTPVMLTAATDINKRVLTIAIWGEHPATPRTVHHHVVATYPFRTLTHHSHNAGTSQVLAKGQEGAKVVTWTEESSGKKHSIGTDLYHASPRIVDVK